MSRRTCFFIVSRSELSTTSICPRCAMTPSQMMSLVSRSNCAVALSVRRLAARKQQPEES